MEVLERSMPFNDRLIDEVRKYPALYNQTRRSFVDTTKRCQMWDDIAKTIHPSFTGELAKRRWLQIRDRYRKELKIVIRHGHPSTAKWRYFRRLTWLDPHLKDIDNPKCEDDRLIEHLQQAKETCALTELGLDGLDDSLYTSTSSQLMQLTTLKEEEYEEPAQPPQLDMVEQLFPSPISDESHDKSEESERGKDKKDESVNVDSSLSFPFLNPLMVNEWANDEDLLFGRLIALRLKKMNKRRAKKIRAKINELIDDAEDEEENEKKK